MLKRLVEKLFWRLHAIPQSSASFDKHDIDALFMRLTQDEELYDFMMALARNDKERYFRAAAEDQKSIRGEYLRTRYFIMQLDKAARKVEKAKNTNLTTASSKKIGGRYAS